MWKSIGISIGLGMVSTTALAVRPLTYEEALDAALRSNPALQTAKFSKDQAEASLVSSRAIMDPALSMNVNYSWDRNKSFFQGIPFDIRNRQTFGTLSLGGTLPTGTSYEVNSSYFRTYAEYTPLSDGPLGGMGTTVQDEFRSNLGLTVSQEVLKGHLYAYNFQNITLARQGLDSAELTVERQRQQTLADTARAYWTWVYQVQLLEIRSQAVAVSEEALRIGKLKADSGELAPLEVTRLEAALVQDKTNQLEVQNAVYEATNVVLLHMGETPGQAILPATTEAQVQTLALDVGDAMAVAMAQNLDLAIARVNLEGARLSHRLARHALLPSLSTNFSAGLGSQATSASMAYSNLFSDQNFPNLSVGGVLSVPLGNHAARGERSRTLASMHSQEIALAEQERQIGAQVAQQVRVLNSAQQRVELTDINVRLAEETLTSEETLAEVGRAIQKDVLEARNSVESARAEAVKARTDYQLALIELKRLQGQLEPTR